MGEKGLSEDSARVHMRRTKWSRLRLMHLTFEGAWRRVSTWIRAKFGHMIPLLVLYFLVNFRGNSSYVQQLTTILVFFLRYCLGAYAASYLDEN